MSSCPLIAKDSKKEGVNAVRVIVTGDAVRIWLTKDAGSITDRVTCLGEGDRVIEGTSPELTMGSGMDRDKLSAEGSKSLSFTTVGSTNEAVMEIAAGVAVRPVWLTAGSTTDMERLIGSTPEDTLLLDVGVSVIWTGEGDAVF